jgi:transglutaminase-like putative cysteine protease
LMSAVTTVTPGAFFFLLVALFIPTILYGLWASMLLGGAERDATDAASKVKLVKTMASRPIPPGMGRIAGLGFAFTAIGYAVVSLLPRYTFFQMLGAGYFMALSGTSGSMELRTDGAETLADSTPVIRVEPISGGGQGLVDGLYARMQLLDRFDGRQFTASTNGALYAVPLPADRQPDQYNSELSEQDTRETVRVTLNRLVRDTAEHPLAVLGRNGPSEIVKRNVRRTLSGTWVAGFFRGTNIIYKARLDRGVTDNGRLPRHLRQLESETLVAVPETLDPRVLALGQELARDKATTREKIDSVLRYLSRGFEYSLEPLSGTSTDPLARFLFEAKKGHCELYAAAVAVLLRVGGVKTRVATGYYGGNWNSLGGYLVYTQQDAHAWVEVFDDAPDGGWRWIDATPEDLRAVRKRSAFQTVRDWWDAVELFWFDNVIDFDESKRRRLVSRFTDRLGAIFADVPEDGEGAEERTNVSRAWVGLLLLVPLAAWIIARARRQRAVDPRALGGRVRRALGAKTGENATLGRLLERVDPEISQEARLCVARYEEWRFGGAENIVEVLAALAALEEARRRQLKSRSGRARVPSPESLR